MYVYIYTSYLSRISIPHNSSRKCTHRCVDLHTHVQMWIRICKCTLVYTSVITYMCVFIGSSSLCRICEYVYVNVYSYMQMYLRTCVYSSAVLLFAEYQYHTSALANLRSAATASLAGASAKEPYFSTKEPYISANLCLRKRALCIDFAECINFTFLPEDHELTKTL